MGSLYVYSAVPPDSNRLLRKYGLLSGVETIKHPEVLKAARPSAKERRAFVKKVEEVASSDRPYSVMGPSVLFTLPDPEKITDKHFIKKWDLQTIRIDLGRLVEDYPDTVVWGAELLPYDYAWRKMSDEEFDDVMADMGYASWEDFAAERSRALTFNEVRDFTQADPVDLWEHYHKSDIGKKYASNVPHAFIITPMGYIPYEYIEYVDEARMNPVTYPHGKHVSKDGYLLNPMSGNDLWYHITSEPDCSWINGEQALYVSMNGKYLLENAGSIIGHRGNAGSLCTVKIKGVTWDKIFDIGDFSYQEDGKLKLTPRGQEIASSRPYGMEISYYYGLYDDHWPLNIGFDGFLEEEGDYAPYNKDGYLAETLYVSATFELVECQRIASSDYGEFEVVEHFDFELDDDFKWRGRGNPLDPSTKVQFSPDGYLINPLDGTTVWWHGYSYDVEELLRYGDIDDEDLELLEQSGYAEEKEFREGGMNWAGVFFTPSREGAVGFARQHEYDTQFIVSVRIRKCKLFDAREQSTYYDLDWYTYEDEDVVRWLKAEGFEGYIELESESLDYFNVCIFNAPKYVEIIKNTNIARPESYLLLRKNPSEYLVNPNTGGAIWWYVTDDPHPEFRVGDGDHRFTWFGGVKEDWEDFGEFNLALRKKYLLEVRIKIPAGCTVFDARSLFPNVPQWVRESLRGSTWIDAEELESEEGYDFIFAGLRSMAIERSTYEYFQDLNITEPSLKAILSTFDIERRTEYLIRLWLLDFYTVQSFLETSKYTEEVDIPIVGWYEIERIDYNYHASINIGLFMGQLANRASHDQGCSNIKVDIVNVISAE